MGSPRHSRGRHHRTLPSPLISLIPVLALLLLFFTSSSVALERGKDKVSGGRNEMSRHHHRRRGADHGRDDLGHRGGWESSGVLWMRLGGPGSSPPTCRSKCGRCTPCRALHVPVHPGRVSVPMEYYPEAWRCKCGNSLFMP
ncbi:hypothetical protein MLD38_039599 [Melastoma candidum]|uniref:Uncharacterized protein n=1 Tax=Melastoma candidum TaxID=119954 RepID=A0ACB9L3B2_9MYRT|nr:hypothetical protein MLD38_039599 [Melastoma candidum]